MTPLMHPELCLLAGMEGESVKERLLQCTDSARALCLLCTAVKTALASGVTPGRGRTRPTSALAILLNDLQIKLTEIRVRQGRGRTRPTSARLTQP